MSNVAVVAGAGVNLDQLKRMRPLKPFSPEVVRFANAVSARLLSHPEMKRLPEVVALAFWLRRGSFGRLASEKQAEFAAGLVLARGLVFHIAPSNVDTIFVYSWFLSLMCGNKNILRLSSRRSMQQELLIDALRDTLEAPEFASINERVSIVRYDHSEEISAGYSEAADTRIIWGGDATVRAIRKIPLSPTANEAAFPDRTALTLISTKAFLHSDVRAQKEVARLFANDCYVFGQAACSSPRAVIWIGENAREAKAMFWPLVAEAASAMDHGVGAHDLVSKRVACDLLAATFGDIAIDDRTPLVTRVETSIAVLMDDLAREIHCGAGLFLEGCACDLLEVIAMFPRRLQTVTYFGFGSQELHKMIMDAAPAGPDRVVPIGSALTFSHLWDGVDFFDVLLRKVALPG
jgi:hypothetical protein